MMDYQWSRVKNILPGFFAFFCFYEFVSGLSMPFYFTANRVTSEYNYQSPLLGFYELDLLIFTILIILLSFNLNKSNRQKVRVLTILSIISSTFSIILGYPLVSYLSLYLVGFISLILYIFDNGIHFLFSGIFVSLLTIEVISLFSLFIYFFIGDWNKLILNCVLKERLLFAPLEWISVFIIILLTINGFIKFFFGKKLESLPRYSRNYDFIDDNFLLLFSVIIICLSIILLHLPSFNPEGLPVSVDTFYYEDFLHNASRRGVYNVLENGRIIGRPLYLLVIFNIWKALPISAYFLMDFIHPLVVISFIAIASFYTVSRKSTSSPGYASLMVSLGYVMTGFLAGGFQANSLALIPAILSLSIDPKGRWGLLSIIFLWILTGLIHPWTHLMYSGVLILYRMRNRRELFLTLLAAVSSYIVINLIDFLIVPGHASLSAVEAASGNLGPYFFSSLFPAVRFWVWNSLSNPLFISINIFSLGGIISPFLGALFPLGLVAPGFLLYRVLLNTPLHLRVGENFSRLPLRYQVLLILILLVRVMGNISGLTPLAE
jgi:hypothetical protein